MATNSILLRKTLDKRLFWATAFLFPAVIFIGFAKSYYLKTIFDPRPLANANVHIHGLVMSFWVLLFAVQIILIRTKNVKTHMRFGMIGVGLAVAVVVSGLYTIYDSLIIRGQQIIGMNPHSFVIIPFTSLMVFIILFSAAILYRKSPTEHKSLMFLTAVNFLPFGFSRIEIVPEEYQIPWAFGGPILFGIAAFVWFTVKTKKLNKVFAAGLLLIIISVPLRVALMESSIWLNAVALIAP
ncbi:MAG: hypothetical protein KDB79_13655 [Acidobacteria bacterium]|nr:hypothetical protein [Acidobacteriota bacterium]